MEFHQQNGAPIFASFQDIREILQEMKEDDWGRNRRENRATIVKSILQHFGGSNQKKKATAEALLEGNDWAKPAFFYAPKVGTDWVQLEYDDKVEKIVNQLKYADSPKKGPFDEKRRYLIDLLLYARMYEWGDPARRDRVEQLNYMNQLLLSAGHSPLYLFNSFDFIAQLTVLLDWSYKKFLEALDSPLKKALDEACSQEADQDQMNPFTGYAEAYLYRIKELGDQTDPPFGKEDKKITAWSFARRFKNEFGRTRVSAYHVLYQLTEHREGLLEDLDTYAGLRSGRVTRSLLTGETSAALMGQKDLLLNLAKAALTRARIDARCCYEEAVEEYRRVCPGKPVPGPVDLALMMKGNQDLRDYVVDRWVSVHDHKSDRARAATYFESYEEKVIHLSDESKKEIDESFYQYIDDVYSSKAQPSQKDKEALRERASRMETLPEAHAIDRTVFLREKDVTKEDILNLILFHANAEQLRALMPPRSIFGCSNVLTANKMVEKINELLLALDMPELHARDSKVDFLLLAGLYNGVDYHQLASEKNKNAYPLKEYCYKVFSSPEAESEA